MSDARVELHSSLTEVASEWDAFVDAMDVPSPFLRSWWIDATASGTPQMVLVLRGDELVGGIALQEDRSRGMARLRHAGAGALAPEGLDLVAMPGKADAVVEQLGGWFVRRGACIVDLEGVAESSQIARALPGPVRSQQSEVARWAVLPDTYEEYLAARPTTMRNSIRRAERRLARDGASYRRVETEGVPRALAELRRLHDLRFGASSTFLPLFGSFANAATAAARRGDELAFHELIVGDQVIASEVWFEVARIASFYQSGRDPDPRWRGSGTVLKARIVEQLCGRGFERIDLLAADDPYKREWAAEPRPVVHLEAAVGVGPRALHALLPAARCARAAVRGRRSRHEM